MIERAVIFHVEAFDWTCPQHITPRFTQDELRTVLEPVRDKLAALEDENERLRLQIAAVKASEAG